MGIIRDLIRENQPFAVMQSFIWMKTLSTERTRVYEVLRVKFHERKGYELVAQDLNESDVSEFKLHIDKFQKVLQNTDGSIYELKGVESFKEFCKNNASQKSMKAA